MEKIVSRPRNEDRGIPLRDKRVAVMMSEEERDALTLAAEAVGMGVSTYLRVKALEAARNDAPGLKRGKE